MLDSLADCMTRIRNGSKRGFASVLVVKSKKVVSLLKVLKSEGFISSFEEVDGKLYVGLKYFRDGRPLISKLAMVSKPSRRIYSKRSEVKQVRGGLGFYVLSTSKGVISSRDLSNESVGGEVVAIVY